MKTKRLICGSLFALLNMQSAMATATTPELEVKFVDTTYVWHDQDSGANDDVSIWRPIASSGYYSLGDVAVAGHIYSQSLFYSGVEDDVQGLVVKALEPGALEKPFDYYQVWDSSGTGSKFDVSIWRPIPLPGYRCLGDVAINNSFYKPSIDLIRCVREDLTVETDAINEWDSGGSEADNAITLFEVGTNLHKSMVAAHGYASIPDATVYSLKDGFWTNPEQGDFLTSIQNWRKNEELLRAYNPAWFFHAKQDYELKPIDIDQSFAQFADLQRLECDKDGKWRLIYNETNGRKYQTKSHGGNRAVTYGFAQPVAGGIDLHYYLYFPYNIGSKWVDDYDHEGDWETVRISLRVKKSDDTYYLKPTMMKTQSHGTDWLVGWDSGDVWLAWPFEYTNSTGENMSYRDELGNQILPPKIFIAKNSNGTYPNTSHERGVFNHPAPSSINRSCVVNHTSVFCDFIETSNDIKDRIRYPVIPITVIKDSNDTVTFQRLVHDTPIYVPWLNTDTSCQSGETPPALNNLTKGINRWGSTEDAGGPQGLQTRTTIWQNTLPIQYAAPEKQEFSTGFTLAPGQSIYTKDARFVLQLQYDGNLVIYNSFFQPVWASHTAGSYANQLIFQHDGNLVLYSPFGAVASRTVSAWGNEHKLVFHSEGFLAIYDESGDMIWHTLGYYMY